MFRIHFQHTHKIYIQFNMYYFELLLLLLLQFQLYKLLWLTVNILSLYSRLVFYFILDWCAVPKKKNVDVLFSLFFRLLLSVSYSTSRLALLLSQYWTLSAIVRYSSFSMQILILLLLGIV